jgi:hypothetical protein
LRDAVTKFQRMATKFAEELFGTIRLGAFVWRCSPEILETRMIDMDRLAAIFGAIHGASSDPKQPD